MQAWHLSFSLVPSWSVPLRCSGPKINNSGSSKKQQHRQEDMKQNAEATGKESEEEEEDDKDTETLCVAHPHPELLHNSDLKPILKVLETQVKQTT